MSVLENWRSLLRMRITEARLTSEYRQVIASLSRSVGEMQLIYTQPDYRSTEAAPAENLDDSDENEAENNNQVHMEQPSDQASSRR